MGALYVALVDILIKAGAEVNIAGISGFTALIFASIKGHIEIAKLLLKAGAAINIADVDGHTAWQHAALNGHAEIVKLLDTYNKSHSLS